MRTFMTTSLVAVAMVSLAVVTSEAQDQLATAKDLYVAAAYEDALSALEHVEGAPRRDLDQQIDQYRAFCLFALGRTSEAESVAELLVRNDPLIELDARDASPRIEAMFTQVRKRLLPSLIRERYRSARAAMEQGQTGPATQELTRVRLMLDNARTLGAWDEGLGDVGLLVDGFLDLMRGPARQPEAAAAAPPPSAQQAQRIAIPPRSATVAERPERQPAAAAQVYGQTDGEVKGPVAIRQELPRLPTNLVTVMRNANKTTGILEITIAEDGTVAEALMRDPVNPMFDGLMIAAARSWRYRPATKDGQPVKYVKRITVSASPPAR